MKFIKGDKIFDGHDFLPPDSVLVLEDDNTVAGIASSTDTDSGKIQHFNGILTPGFVNAHCHLELSHLHNSVPQHTGVPGFGKHIVSLREKTPREERISRMKEADRLMGDNGIVAVGDISNSPESVVAKKNSRLFYHTFIELLSLNPEQEQAVFARGLETKNVFDAGGLSSSLAPHAPYSASLELIRAIAAFDGENNLPFSIHNQESPEEDKFFNGEKNGFSDLYKFLEVDISFFKPPKQSSLMYYAGELPGSCALLVHNTCTTLADYLAAAGKNIYWCFCPSANLYIENKLPDYPVFAGEASRICVGTDSLASNSTLDVLQEINLLLKKAPFTPSQLLRAITSNPAKALAIDARFGSLEAGRRPGLNLIEERDARFNFLQKIF